MFKINDNFRVEKDKYNWILKNTYMGKDKDGNDKIQETETYHATLENLCNSMLDKAIEGDTTEKILEAIHTAKYQIKVAIKEYCTK